MQIVRMITNKILDIKIIFKILKYFRFSNRFLSYKIQKIFFKNCFKKQLSKDKLTFPFYFPKIVNVFVREWRDIFKDSESA